MSEVPPVPPPQHWEQAPEPQGPPPEITGFPAWIKAAGALVVILLLVSIVRMGPVFREALAIERAHKDIAAGKFAQAAQAIKPIADKHLDSIDLQLDLVEAQTGAKDLVGAVNTMLRIEGKSVSKEQGERADRIGADLKQQLEEAGK